MALTYHFSFSASASTNAAVLEKFLRNVEGDARLLGFAPTTVVNGPFDSQPRRDFARRIARGLVIEDSRLIGRTLPKEACWSYGPSTGYCRLAPTYGVFLVVTDSDARETAFGFFRYPTEVHDVSGQVLMTVPGDDGWISGNFVNTSDSRYRALVRRFRDGGYLASERDEFALPQCGQ